MTKKVLQLEEWPEPTEAADVASFLAFVNYLREFMDPEWVKYEAILSPFRKKDCDFDGLWNGKEADKYKDAFEKAIEVFPHVQCFKLTSTDETNICMPF